MPEPKIDGGLNEMLYDPETGKPLAMVCLREPITDDERATLVEYFLWLRDHKSGSSGVAVKP